MNLAEKIRKLRKDRKWSQGELAEKIKVHITHISRLETERYAPSVDMLKKLAGAFEVTSDYLLYDDMENIGPMNFKDKPLYEKMKLIDELEEKDREIIHGVVDAFLVKQQMWNVLNKQVNPA